MEQRKRSILKAITFRFIATIATAVLVLMFTNNLALAGIIGGLDLITKLIIYYLHERVWNKVTWGMKTPKPAPQES